MDKQLKTVAAASRREIESFARKHHNIGFEGSDKDLSCYCAIASYFLVMVGRKLGYKLTLVEGLAFDDNVEYLQDGGELDDLFGIDPNHCWVEHGGKIIDLSAKQFNSSLQEVHIVDTDDDDYWSLNSNNVVRRNLKNKWPDDQSPYTYLGELRDRAKKVVLQLA